jgi:GTPase SAR1 family protein
VNKKLQIKIVYYGPAMSGKTTSIKYLFSYFNKESLLESIDNSIGRTLFFDFGVLQFKGAEWVLKLLVFSATGQDFYASTRPATLNGVDGIIFVADSQIKFMGHNMRSWNELKTLFGNDIYNIPIVIALNKYDLENVKKINEVNFLNCIASNKFKNLMLKKTVALRGEGIIDSFFQLIKSILPQLDLKVNLKN